MKRLENKVAIVTGAAGGIGLSTVKLFIHEGAKVIATDLQQESLETEINKLAAGDDVLALALDVSSQEGWQNIVSQAIEKFGKIDVLVNNAGIHIAKGILGAELADWQLVMNINTTGVFLGMKTVIPHMQKNGKGSIVNISSVAAFLGGDNADGGSAAYSASKGAVRSLSKHAAQNFAKDSIRVNTVHPGPVFTPMMGKVMGSFEAAQKIYKLAVPLPPFLGEPEDVANGILYLAADESKYVTGEELVIDGGLITR